MSSPETVSPAAGVAPAAPAAAPPQGTVSARMIAGVALAAAGPIALMFASRFRYLYELWGTDENYSHGYLVPFVSGYLAWRVLAGQGAPTNGQPALGAAFLGVGCLLRLTTLVLGLPPLDFLALAAMLFGLAAMLGGAHWARGFVFPIAFLLFMFPLPTAIDIQLAVWLQSLVSTVATATLQLFVPCYQDGNHIMLPGQPLEVGEACSGLRQVVAFSALTLLVAYLGKNRLPFRVGIVLAGVPVAVIANLLRVLLMAFLTLHFGLESISEHKMIAFGISYHEGWGLLTMAVGLGLLLGVAWWLGRIFPNRAEDDETPAAPPDKAGDDAAAATPALSPRSQFRWLGGTVIALVLAALVQQLLVAHLSAAEGIVAGSRSEYLTKPLQGPNGFPASLGPWEGKDAPPEPPTRPYYDKADDKLNRNYTLTDGSPESGLTCQLWMIHYHDATDRRHFPTGCYRGAGWTEDPSGRADESLPGGGGGCARKFCFLKGRDNPLISNVYYWYYTLEPPASLGLSPLQRVHEAWAIRRPSLTVQVFTTAHTPEQLARIEEFVHLVDAKLQDHLPPGARRDSHILPYIDLRAPRTKR